MGKKVLYIEDTEALQRMYAFGLQQEGFEVVVVGTAGEALAQLEDVHFDVILLDLMLAGMSGLDILKSSDIHAKSPDTKIVVLTNLDNPRVKERVESYGIDGYLSKYMYEPKQLAGFLKTLA